MNHSAALDIALAYDAAWTAKDVDTAMTFIADDIVCESPNGTMEGAAAYRGFIEGFNQVFTGADVLAALGDDTTAIIVQDTHTQVLDSAKSVSQYTVQDGKITRALIVFDRVPYEEAARAAA
jgi:ketosteroid isomerase-like protein